LDPAFPSLALLRVRACVCVCVCVLNFSFRRRPPFRYALPTQEQGGLRGLHVGHVLGGILVCGQPFRANRLRTIRGHLRQPRVEQTLVWLILSMCLRRGASVERCRRGQEARHYRERQTLARSEVQGVTQRGTGRQTSPEGE